MRMTRFVLFVLLAGCATSPNGGSSGDDGAADTWGPGADPLLMPPAVVRYIDENQWGDMHLKWHTVRQWDLLNPSDQSWAQGKGWKRADVQEGLAGNGLEFLAMHRMMMQMLIQVDANAQQLLVGWTTPPTDPMDKRDPLPNEDTTPFDTNMLAAIDKLENHIDSFTSDDDLGLYIETSLRPTADDPSSRATDRSAGIHNYIHNRFSDSSSKIDIGDPTVNLKNKRFWRLHGWIDGLWTKYRAQAGKTDMDADYQAALMVAMANMPPPKSGLGAGEGDQPPDSLTKWFENHDQ
jgi:hypothetical protein